MSTMDDYRRGWALRYLREAKVGLTVAQETPSMAPKLVLDAMRKAQAAIYYTLGEPYFVEMIVQQTLHEKPMLEDPLLKCLVEIERMVQRAVHTPGRDHQGAIKEASVLIQVASDVVELFTGESAGD